MYPIPFFLSEIGVGLAGFGIAFLFLGILFFFDKGLLAIGNVSIYAIIYKRKHNKLKSSISIHDVIIIHSY